MTDRDREDVIARQTFFKPYEECSEEQKWVCMEYCRRAKGFNDYRLLSRLLIQKGL